MLELFHIKEEDAVRVQSDPLRATVTTIFEKLNVPEEDARLAADVLVTADLRGVDSHGVSNMLRAYIEGYNRGEINPRPRWEIVRETPATANVDSDTGLGIIVVPKAMEIAIDKARNTGVGMVTISNGRHLGMASYHAMMALKHDMIGTCMTACPPAVLPTFGAEPMMGTNPIALAAPAKEELPFVFDAATSIVPVNKLRMIQRLGAKLPAGWVADDEGNPIMEPIEAPTNRLLLPLGGTPGVRLPQGLRTRLYSRYTQRHTLRNRLRNGARPPQLQPFRWCLQHRGLHRGRPVQGANGRFPSAPSSRRPLHRATSGSCMQAWRKRRRSRTGWRMASPSTKRSSNGYKKYVTRWILLISCREEVTVSPITSPISTLFARWPSTYHKALPGL